MTRKLFNMSLPIHSQGTIMKHGGLKVPAVMTGVINARQTAITFGGGPVTVMVMWKIIGAAVPELTDSKLVALILSLFTGMAMHTPTVKTRGTARQKTLGYLYAFINSFSIAAAVLGIDNVLTGASFMGAGE